MEQFNNGHMLQRRYLVQATTARGGESIVYSGIDTRLFNRRVAIKVLQDQRDKASFLRALRAEVAIRHPAVAAPYDYGESDEGTPYAVYEIIPELVPLEKVLDPPNQDGARIVSLVRILGDALDAIHREGLVHRFVEPSSIRVQNPGGSHEYPLIADFGGAVLAGEMVAWSRQGRYWAPEESQPHAATTASDLFSFSATSYWMLTGRDPPEEFSLGQPLGSPLWPDGVSSAVREVLSRGLASTPSNRYSNAREFSSELANAVLSGSFATGAPPRPLRVFLCHSSTDKDKVRELYRLLVAHHIDVWFDEAKLIPGQDWRLEIANAIKLADVIVVCVSNSSVSREGFVQREVRWALDLSDEKPEGTIFVIPARLEPCELPTKLRGWQWVDLHTETGFEKLVKALRTRAGARAN